MLLRFVVPSLIACSCLSLAVEAQEFFSNTPTIQPGSTGDRIRDFEEVVFPITSVKITSSLKVGFTGMVSPKINENILFGTGFCLDIACRFIATNYHVAVVMRTRKIQKQKIVQRYFATGPQDKGATLNAIPRGGDLPYAVGRDLAVYELRYPVPRRHGLAFSLDELEVGQEVDIYGYPLVGINPFRKLLRFPAVFKGKTTSGLLAFDYRLSDHNRALAGGASGSIVVDRKTGKIVGVLCGISGATALAVPAKTLADFVSKVQPFLAQKIFPEANQVSPVGEDIYAKFGPRPDFNPKFEPVHSGILQRRPEEPHDVVILREKAQRLAENMRNLIAVQSYAWGSGDKEPKAEAEYEVRVIDGDQRFRRHPDGKKELKEVPAPPLNDWVLAGDQWSTLPEMVGREYWLKIHQADNSFVNGSSVKVFQYRSSIEDNLCPFHPQTDFGFFKVGKTVAVGCYGEVWTDENMNIIRISENLDLSDKLRDYQGYKDFRVVLTYGWIKIAEELSQLVPLTIFTEAFDGKRTVWCRGTFTNYRMFGSHSTVMPNWQPAEKDAAPVGLAH